MVIGLVLAAVVGGVAGGLIVRATLGVGKRQPVDGTGLERRLRCLPGRKVADQTLPSVVTIHATGGQGGGSGSGVVIRSGGYILTNNHVISAAAGGGALSILRSDGETTDATIVGRDPLTDLAVIKANGSSDLPPITVGESESLQIGQPFVAEVTPGGSADKAGLRPGDVIVEIDGEPAHSADALIVKTIEMKPGDVIHLKYERDGASHTTSLTLAPG